MRTLILAALLAVSLSAQSSLSKVRKLYIEKMQNDMDQYIRAEIFKQTKGRFTVVLEKADADAIMAGVSERENGTAKVVTGRYLGLHDNTTASVSILSKDEKQILWADEAGDRSLLFSIARRGGQRKVAQRIVSKLMDAAGKAK